MTDFLSDQPSDNQNVDRVVVVCPNCGHEDHIFGDGGAQAEAEKLGVPFMGAVPLERDIRLKADEGVPIVISQPESTAAKRYFEIAEKLRGVLAP